MQQNVYGRFLPFVAEKYVLRLPGYSRPVREKIICFMLKIIERERLTAGDFRAVSPFWDKVPHK